MIKSSSWPRIFVSDTVEGAGLPGTDQGSRFEAIKAAAAVRSARRFFLKCLKRRPTTTTTVKNPMIVPAMMPLRFECELLFERLPLGTVVGTAEGVLKVFVK